MSLNRFFYRLGSRKLRIKIMQFLSFIPDIYMVKFQYWIKTQKRLNLENPKRFTEKLQYYKLFYRDPIMKICVDKYDVRDYIKNIGYGNLLVDCIGVYNKPEEIDFEGLPEKFVAKDTLGGGGNAVVIVKDKRNLNIPNLKKKMQAWVDEPINKKHPGREWVYDGHKHRIIIEKYIETDPQQGGLIDYKFFCNYGKTKFLYVVADRVLGQTAGFGIFSPDFKKMPVTRADESPLIRDVPKPNNYDELRRIAEDLAKPFPEARIDLYDVDGIIYFGEITFFDGSGYMTFTPDEYDTILGDMFTFKIDDKKWQK